MSLAAADIQEVAGVVFDLCGIVLDDTKGYLVESRLEPLMRLSGCRTFHELAQRSRHPDATALRTQIVDAITTNETLFFRDGSPFEALEHKVVPEMIDARAGSLHPKRLRIWSAACSTGQEPYSIAMVLSNLLPDTQSWDLTILATDISDAAIRQASRGWYSKFEIERGMKPDALARYFQSEGDGFRARDELRSLVSFQRMNLLEGRRPPYTFDIIFCRNVAIYFSPADRRRLFEGLASCLAEDGYLFVGSSESLLDLGPSFKPHHHCRSTFYRPRLPLAARD